VAASRVLTAPTRAGRHHRPTRATTATPIIQQIRADLKACALAHLPSGVVTANATRLVLPVIAFTSLVRLARWKRRGWSERPPQLFVATSLRSPPVSRPQHRG
jgi:hypothetical protein